MLWQRFEIDPTTRNRSTNQIERPAFSSNDNSPWGASIMCRNIIGH